MHNRPTEADSELGVWLVFFSTYESAIDAKGRVSVPASFRAALGGVSRIYVWPSFDGRSCLEAGGEALMGDYRQILSRMSPSDPAREAIVHAVFGRSADLKMDDPGRIKLPDAMLDYAGIEKQVVFVGAFDRFRIWSPDRFAAYDAEMAVEAAANRNKLDAPFQSALAAGALSARTGEDGE
ncbi:MAG: division/cell wall cluster transcriptional repressor MraZ [Pseudomonadota bacterium]